MKKYLTIALIFLAVSTVLGLQLDLNNNKEDNKIFTVYLVRHAEKDLSSNTGGNPPLTECGEQRAEMLNRFFSHVHLDAVYSTNYTRTENTALPTARSKELEIQEYSAQDLEAFSNLLIERQQNALVVGHSNTTGILAGLLAGEKGEDIDLDTYNRIYQVVLEEKQGRIHLFHTAFDCKD